MVHALPKSKLQKRGQVLIYYNTQMITKKNIINQIDFKKMGGFVPVITQDFKTDKILMLGFMNKEALKKTLKGDKVVYWSRSRKKFWVKGETSNNYQFPKEVFLDCDSDTLLIKVKQMGNVCHTGNKTCFFKKII